jgi:hypothetical protein
MTTTDPAGGAVSYSYAVGAGAAKVAADAGAAVEAGGVHGTRRGEMASSKSYCRH